MVKKSTDAFDGCRNTELLCQQWYHKWPIGEPHYIYMFNVWIGHSLTDCMSREHSHWRKIGEIQMSHVHVPSTTTTLIYILHSDNNIWAVRMPVSDEHWRWRKMARQFNVVCSLSVLRFWLLRPKNVLQIGWLTPARMLNHQRLLIVWRWWVRCFGDFIRMILWKFCSCWCRE